MQPSSTQLPDDHALVEMVDPQAIEVDEADVIVPSRPNQWWALAGFGALVAGAAAVGSRFGPNRAGTTSWYRQLRKPPFQPPPAVFAPVWTGLYATIAVSGWRVWRAQDQPHRRLALGCWAGQLAANAAWTPTFFGARNPKASLVVLGAQLGLTAAFTGVAAGIDPPAAVLLAPYLGWTSFAGLLNAEIVRRN